MVHTMTMDNFYGRSLPRPFALDASAAAFGAEPLRNMSTELKPKSVNNALVGE